MNSHTAERLTRLFPVDRRILYFFFLFIAYLPTAAQTGYFQQRVDYNIKVVLNDRKHRLSGHISMRYQNNSPDTLRFIWIHLWPNGYADRNTALTKQMLENNNQALFFAPDSSRGFIDSLEFSTAGNILHFVPDSLNRDIIKLLLAEPLSPGSAVTLESPFRVQIPDAKYSRLGHIGQSYMISQWYPKPAVYDRNGWHPMPYLDQGEFYSEFGSFKVSLTLPANYRVAATGRLVEEKERNWLRALSDSTLREKDNLENTGTFPKSDSIFKTITFEQDSIHDFAWFADKRFHVTRSEFQLERSGKIVEAWTFFTGQKKTNLWLESNRYIEQAIQFYSGKLGDYPYTHYTVVDGAIAAGGGMEYPMLTVIGTPERSIFLETFIAHEAGHSWLYGILASNEREYPWMDEGLNTFYELKYAEHYYPGKEGKGMSDWAFPGLAGSLSGTSELNFREGFDLAVRFSGHNNSDQPANLPAPEYTYTNYGTVIYTKVALSFDFLNAYLGDTLFNRCAHTYFDQWKFRHPGPTDVQSVFETVSGEKLDWFFSGILGSNQPHSYKIKGVEKSDSGYVFRIRNCGEFPVPFSTGTIDSMAEIHHGFTGEQRVNIDAERGDRVLINGPYMGIMKQKGYGYRTNGILRRFPKTGFTIFPKIDVTPGTANINVLPVVAWNRYNGWMTGAWLSTYTFIPKPLEVSLTPLYDWNNNSLAGTASIMYHVWPLNGLFRSYHFMIPLKKFSYSNNDYAAEGEPGVMEYLRIAPEADAMFRKKKARSTFSHGIGIRYTGIWQEEIKYNKPDTVYIREFTTTRLDFVDLKYFFSNERVLDPFNGKINFQSGSGFLKAGLEFNYRFSYAKKRKGIDVRIFTGTFLNKNESQTRNYNFRMSGWEGSQDYQYEEYYFGRTDDHGLWKQQFMIKDGGFKAPTALGQTGDWLAALNLTADLPLPLPIKLFGDFGTYSGIGDVIDDINNKVMYDAGIALVPFKGLLEVYFPLFASDDMEHVWETNNVTFAEKIRFVLNIKALDPYFVRNRITEMQIY